MLDEDAYHASRRQLNQRPCPFEKAVMRGCCGCHRVRQVLIAERQTAACTEEASWHRCRAFFDALRDKARFALHIEDPEAPLPHAQKLRLQCGGLLALQTELAPGDDAAPSTVDIDRLLAQAEVRYPKGEGLPWSSVMRGVSHYVVRARARR